jgi:crotonobetainyl-CoA:carnitine CoA-transferase CaiB-like acyl-CoA transferase
LRLGLVADLEHASAGRLRQAGQLMRFSHTPAVVQRAAPLGGQHTLEILDELGYEKATVEAYLDRGIIATV